MPNNSADNTLLLHCLSQLTLDPGNAEDGIRYLSQLSPRSGSISSPSPTPITLSCAHYSAAPARANGNAALADWASEVLARQQRRIENALVFLQRITQELEKAGCPVTVMKSLDHWPDLGNDLDLFTTADEKRVREVIVRRMGARLEARSWGDRLANKWNFCVPGLPELIEVHAQRLGQTGEQTLDGAAIHHPSHT